MNATDREHAAAIVVVANEAERLGYKLDSKSFLLGYLIGRDAPASLQSESKLKRLCEMLLAEREPAA